MADYSMISKYSPPGDLTGRVGVWFRRRITVALLLTVAATGACVDVREPVAASTDAGSSAICGTELAAQVKAALRAAPDVNDTHIDVHCEDGKVVLTGLVDDNRALLDALRVAKRAAKGHQIVDSLSIMKLSAH